MGQFQGVPGPSQDAFDAQTQAIANLNSKITPGSWIALNSTYGVYYMKVSGILFIQCVYNNTNIPSTLLGTLPEGYRPSITSMRVRNYTGNGYMTVSENGNVYVSSTDWVNCLMAVPCSE